MSEASTEFITDKKYDWRSEFANRSFSGGTRMPLTYYCSYLEIDFYWRPGRSDYADKEMVLTAKFKLTELGKRKFRFLRAYHDLDRTTLGTVAFWMFRRNERRRQVRAIKERSKNEDWQTLKKEYVLKREAIIDEVYKYAIQEGIDYLTDIIKNQDWALFKANCTKYISDMKKKQVSMVGVEYDRYPYQNVLDVGNPRRLIEYFVDTLILIRDNFYSKYRLNPKFMLSALRNRPIDILSMTETSANGTMDRSREALGQPPFSLFWMFVYAIKKKIIIECLNRIEKIYNVKFYDPLRYSDFYFRFTQKQDGLYIFGDNGMLIEGGKIIAMYDLSISDVFQGWLRRDDEGRNFCFFVRLNDEYDCGSTGDALTSLWNIEGQIFIWRVFLDGKLTTKKKWPEIKDLIEQTDTFLGHCWCDILCDWFAKGVRLTTDNSRKMISFNYQKGRRNHIEWESKDEIPANEFLATAISSGMLEDLKLTRFYEWVKDKKDIHGEDLGVIEQIKTAKDIPGFMKLTNVNLQELAEPYKLTNYTIPASVAAS